MKLNKKQQEATINLMILTGVAWRQVEHLLEVAPDSDDGFQIVLDALDRFFYGLFRTPDQTLLSYCSDHREALREVEKHGIKIPAEVEG